MNENKYFDLHITYTMRVGVQFLYKCKILRFLLESNSDSDKRDVFYVIMTSNV